MSYKFSLFSIIGLVIAGTIFNNLFGYLTSFVLKDAYVINFCLNILLSILLIIYYVRCFFYQIKITDAGLSESSDIHASKLLSYLLLRGRKIQLSENIEYTWDKVHRIELTSHWFFPCVGVKYIVDSKVKVFKISRFLSNYSHINRKIKQFVDPYFIDDDAMKLM